VDWARFYLTKAGYLDSSERGVWSLTRKTVYVVNEEFFREFMSADK
jgi:restriction endonuclease Mrr